MLMLSLSRACCEGENLDFVSRKPGIELASLYVDQVPPNDLSRSLSNQYGFRLSSSIRDALTLGRDRMAVDGVLIIGEHGNYPQNEKGQDLYPRKRFFDETVAVLQESNLIVPIYMDKHLSHSWDEAKTMYEEAKRLHIPLMAGSSVPLTWRLPPVEIPRGARLQEIVGISYHTLYGYGFHGLEMVQCLAERRKGGETGVKRVQCLEGVAVWEAGRQRIYDRSLLDAAIAAVPGPKPAVLEAAVPNPVLFLIEYLDGFRASLFTLNPLFGAWAAAWNTHENPNLESTLFWTQEARPLGHFTFLVRQIDEFMHTRKSPRPVERTLLTGGMLDFLLTSKLHGGVSIDTPELDIKYQPIGAWKDPGPPPLSRPQDLLEPGTARVALLDPQDTCGKCGIVTL